MIAEFFKPHEEAARIVAQKTPVQKRVFKELLPELRARAFTVAGIESLDQIGRVQEAITDYTRGQTTGGEGVTWDDAKKRIVSELPFLDDAAASKRATVLLRTHGFQASQAAEYNSALADDNITHFKYIATKDAHVRDEHLALNGLVLPKDDPFWQDHFPPWDWGCRCQVVEMSQRAVEREKERDRERLPEDRRVYGGAQLEALRHGTVIRAPQKLPGGNVFRGGTFNVTSPKQTEGAAAFQWHPENLRMDLGTLREKYRGEPELWRMFEVWARKTKWTKTATVWQWLQNLPEEPAA